MAFSRKHDTERAIKKMKFHMELCKKKGNMPGANEYKRKIEKAIKNG